MKQGENQFAPYQIRERIDRAMQRLEQAAEQMHSAQAPLIRERDAALEHNRQMQDILVTMADRLENLADSLDPATLENQDTAQQPATNELWSQPVIGLEPDETS